MRMNAGGDGNTPAGDSIKKALEFAENHSGSFLEELKSFLRIPSVGTKPENKKDTIAAAHWLADSLIAAGVENVQVIATDGMPLVYGDWLHAGTDRPTVLIYGHYDVQPAEPLDQWNTAPFEPTINGSNLFCRGASDDKGQLFIHVKAIESYIKSTGRLPLNVKILFEGEEEAGGEAIEKYVTQNGDLLAADAVLISDSAMISSDQPAIVYSIRGNCYVFLDIYGPSHDLHSGTLGGIVDNPINVLGHIISKLKDENGLILIPGFYDHVRALTEVEKAALAKLPVSEEQLLKETGAVQLWGEPEFTITERLGARPTLDVHGVIGGFTGEGSKTIVPAHVHAKISMRLVPDQEAHSIYEQFEKYVQQIAPPTARVEVRFAHSAEAIVLDLESSSIKAASAAFQKVFGTDPLFVREGGSIPVVAVFKKQLGLDAVMMGFGLPDDRIHSPNEHFYLPNFYRGIQTVINFFDTYGNGSF